MNADPRAVAMRWFDQVWDRRRESAIHEMLTEDSVCYADSGVMHGADEFRDRMYRPFVAAFPDLKITILDTVAEGDRVALRWTARGTHTGDGLGFAKTDRTIDLAGMTFLRIEGDKLAEGWQTSNITQALDSLRS
jgi:steroid delta-isomerase-like uncharacterized protein